MADIAEATSEKRPIAKLMASALKGVSIYSEGRSWSSMPGTKYYRKTIDFIYLGRICFVDTWNLE